jgi:aminoglycoside phosphotransferase family enzyme
MAKVQIKIPQSVVQKYLSEKEGRPVEILKYERLGSGWHGTGYKVKFKVQSSKSKISSKFKGQNSNNSVKEVVLRTLMPVNFGHDWLSDRAGSFVLQHKLAQEIPDHIVSFDVSGYSNDNKLVSLGGIKEFFHVVKVAEGVSYSQDFARIKESGELADGDLKRAKYLSDYLVRLHSKKFKGSRDELRSIRRRHSRDAVGHGEMMMGVIDSYPDKFDFATGEDLADLICRAVKFREKIKDLPVIPCRMHGDFHPGNILFNGRKMTVLDASREVFGDPADDLTAMAINYIWFAVMQTGQFDGPFAELFNIFWKNYVIKAKDRLIVRTAGVFFAFRGVVVAHPLFYSMQSDSVRRKMVRFVENVLDDKAFDPRKINEYLGV